MKPPIILFILTPRFVFAIVNMMVGIQSECKSLIDCFSKNDSHTVCYQGHCVPCRQSNESCSNSAHCCSGSRCYRHQCTPLYQTGHSCRLNRECYNVNDYCINRICTTCIPLWSSCSLDPSHAPCCVGTSICRSGICQPASVDFQSCTSTFDCANDLICLSGKCQDPLGTC